MAQKLQPIPKEMIINKMKFDNCWWDSGLIDEDYVKLNRRLYFDLFFKLAEDIEIKRAVLLMGPRRVGKTVMMHHTIHRLITEKKIRNNKICFINVENPLYLNLGLDELFAMARAAIGSEDVKGWYVFFDEIQYLKDWEVHLKVLVDDYPNTKFIASGSAAAALKIKSEESGAGRFTEFLLPPLTFHEYMHLRNLEGIMYESAIFFNKKALRFYKTNNIALLNKHFVDYINFGGYPEVIFSEKMQSNMGRYVKSDIIDKVLLRDLPSLYGIQNQQELNKFFTTLVYYTAQELSFDSLSKRSGVNKPTLKKYLEYLEAAFLIKQIYKVDESGKKFKRQSAYKIYLTNPSLRSALFSPLEPTDNDMGHMVETAIFSQWLHRENVPCYARWDKGEVDMVILSQKDSTPKSATEIKWSNDGYEDQREIRPIISFCENHNINDAFVTTLDIEKEKLVGNVNLHFVPSSVYAYNVGVNTIRQHQHT
jgi:uncharacterized protein